MAGCNIRGHDGVSQGAAFQFPSALSELHDNAQLGLLARLLPRRSAALPTPTETTEVDWISGTSMLIRRALFDDIGLFDEGFFLYFEEVDFSRRARRAGWRLVLHPRGDNHPRGSVSTGMGNRAAPDAGLLVRGSPPLLSQAPRPALHRAL